LEAEIEQRNKQKEEKALAREQKKSGKV